MDAKDSAQDAVMTTDVVDPVRQAAVIPIRDGQVCLVTSKSGKRWVIPKGKIDPEHTATEAALVEAWEEAGLHGRVIGETVGAYVYEKVGRAHHVLVFIMEVTEIADTWPEQSIRTREWLDAETAASRVIDDGLPEMIRVALKPMLV
jgi:8-oxo-dGTP pyrophosphatase MutT (NUDIX family)